MHDDGNFYASTGRLAGWRLIVERMGVENFHGDGLTTQPRIWISQEWDWLLACYDWLTKRDAATSLGLFCSFLLVDIKITY